MITFNISSARANQRLRDYAKLAQKSMQEAVREESVHVSSALMKLTPPQKSSIGKNRVLNDIQRVFLRSAWFLDIFHFRKKGLDETVKAAVRAKDEGGLEKVFERSRKLSKVKLEAFSPSRHKSIRKRGRVPERWSPGSFPLSDQGSMKKYIREKQKLVGLARASWAACLQALGKSIPGWLQKPGSGAIKNRSADPSRPKITLISKIPYMQDLDARKGIVKTALAGRVKALSSKIDFLLKKAARG